MSIVSGIRSGIRSGLRSGINPGSGGGGGGGAVIPTDATSGKGVPLTQADWDAVFAAASMSPKTLSQSWGMQDLAGAPAAEVGTALTVGGAVEYQQAVAGWTRKGIRITETGSERLTIGAGVGPNPSLESMIIGAYVDLTAVPAASGRQVMGCGGAPLIVANVTTTPRPRLTVNATNTVGTTDPVAGGAELWILQHDVVASTSILYTPQEKIVGTFAALGDGIKGFGAVTAATAQALLLLLGFMFAGAHARWTSAEMKAVYAALGTAVPW